MLKIYLMIDQGKKYNVNQIFKEFLPKAKINDLWEIRGGITAKMFGVHVLNYEGTNSKYVLRLFTNINFPKYAQKVTKEYILLDYLKNKNIPTPEPFYFDLKRKIINYPYIILEYIEGETILDLIKNENFINHIALTLTKIHKTPVNNKISSFLTNSDISLSGLISSVTENQDIPRNLRKELSNIKNIKLGINQNVLIHGDYWPGNILWTENNIVGVIDWEDACLGDPLQDLANTRLEILWSSNKESMEQFLTQYKANLSSIIYDNLPYWDLLMALRKYSQFEEWYQGSSQKQEIKEKYYWFINQAVEQIHLKKEK